MSRSKKPAPEPPLVTADGYRIVLGQPLSIDSEHARIATRDFAAYFVSHPGGFISPGITHVRKGSLADDRSPLVLRYPGNFRRPTPADRAAATSPAEPAV